MGEVSSDTPEAIGKRLGQSLVEQCCDLGLEGEELAQAMRTAINTMLDRVVGELVELKR